MREFFLEMIWTLFWVLLALIGLAFHWPVWLVVVLFAMAGVIYIDGDIF